ncbi:AraC family transcriptional regulator [Rhodocytophaga rosea]|uniref:AraC family transcriptional regulator n=1 Tax=Rhodocytophaga rosea TaxID=2704465 RepID=A0A6C0GPR5_9BACT|nr:helix-turn-helix domain-containing protein [Rhodocytophaga rosea]QHT70046.1 AraC family transcriptional regulator [Rhodocytophaga rosea]
MENWKAVVYLLASGQGILLSLALLPVRKQHPSNTFLGLILLVISLELLNAWGMQVKYHSSPDVFPFWLLQSYLMLPPSVWLFAQMTTYADFVFHRKHLLFYIPAGVDIAVQMGWYLHFRFVGHSIHLLDIKAWFLFAEILPILWMGVVLAVYAQRLLVISGQLKKEAIHVSVIHLVKIYGVFVFLLLLTILWIAAVLMYMRVFSLIELIITLFLFALGYIGYFNPAFFEVPKLLKKKTAGTEPPLFPNYNDQVELERLTHAFEQHSLHMRSKLSLEELAGELNVPSRYVSYLINRYHATNFHSFVNTYRVKEVIRKINDPAQQHKTLLALALESGFNSKSAFNQVFKTHTGQSPSEYLLVKR